MTGGRDERRVRAADCAAIVTRPAGGELPLYIQHGHAACPACCRVQSRPEGRAARRTDGRRAGWRLFLSLFIFIYLFSPPPHGLCAFPFMGGSCSSLRATGNAREPTSHLSSPAGGTSPQTGRHWESIPGPPDPQTDVLPIALTRPL